MSRSGRPICAAGDSVLRLGKKWILLMRWGGYWNADGSEARASVPWLLKAAIRGGFTLGLDHFISEMAAFFQ